MVWKTGESIGRDREWNIYKQVWIFLSHKLGYTKNITLFSIVKLNVLNVRTYNLNHFNKGSVFPQSFHLRVQLILDFLSSSFSPTVGDLHGIPASPASPEIFLTSVYWHTRSVHTLTWSCCFAPQCSLVNSARYPQKASQGWSVLPCFWILPKCMETCALSFPLGLLETSRPHKPSQALADGNQVCTTMSLHLIMLSFLFTQPASWMETPPGLLLLYRQWCLWNWKTGMWSFRAMIWGKQSAGGVGFCMIVFSERSLFVFPSSVYICSSQLNSDLLALFDSATLGSG